MHANVGLLVNKTGKIEERIKMMYYIWQTKLKHGRKKLIHNNTKYEWTKWNEKAEIVISY